MTKRVLIQARELENAAERAGGYVAPPGSLKENRAGMMKFSAVRQYSLQHNKPISQLTAEDYRKMGIQR